VTTSPPVAQGVAEGNGVTVGEGDGVGVIEGVGDGVKVAVGGTNRVGGRVITTEKAGVALATAAIGTTVGNPAAALTLQPASHRPARQKKSKR
jgi:hypothetical protein